MSLTTTLVAVSLSVMLNMTFLAEAGGLRMVSLFVPSLSMTWSADVLPLSYWLRSLFLWSFPFLWNVLCGRGQLNTLGGGVQPFGDSRSDDLRSTIPFVILESSTKKGSHTLPTTPEKKKKP